MNGKVTNWEKICAKHLSNNWYVPRIHKELSKPKTIQTNLKMGDGKIANKHIKRFSISLVIKEMQIKATMK